MAKVDEIINTIVDFVNGDIDKEAVLSSVKMQLISFNDLDADSKDAIVSAIENYTGDDEELSGFISKVSAMLSHSQSVHEHLDRKPKGR